MPESPAKQFQTMKATPGKEYSFGMGGTAKQMAFMIDKVKKPEALLLMTRQQMQKDKLKTDPTMLNYGTAVVEGPAVVLTCQLEPKATLKKAMMKYFKDGGAQPVPKIRLVGPDGQEVVGGEEEETPGGTTPTPSPEGEGKTLDQIKDEFKELCKTDIGILKPFADKTAVVNGWTTPQKEEFTVLWRQAGQLWNGGKDGFYDRCHEVLQQAKRKKDEYQQHAQARLGLVGQIPAITKSIEPLGRGASAIECGNELARARTDLDSIVDTGPTASRVEELKRKIVALKGQLDQAKTAMERLAPSAKKSPTGWIPADFASFQTKFNEAQSLLIGGQIPQYYAAAVQAQQLFNEGGAGPAIQAQLERELRGVMERIRALPEGDEEKTGFQRNYREIESGVVGKTGPTAAMKKFRVLHEALTRHENELKQQKPQTPPTLDRGTPPERNKEEVFREKMQDVDRKKEKIAEFMKDETLYKALENLIKEMKKRAPELNDESFAPFRDNVSDLYNKLRVGVLDAATPVDEDRLIEGATTRRAKVLEDINRALSGGVDQLLMTARRTDVDVKKKKEYEAGVRDMDVLLQQLYEAGLPEFKTIEGRVKKFKLDHDSNPVEGMQAMPVQLGGMRNALETHNNHTTGVIRTVTGEVDTFVSDVEKLRSSLKEKPFAVGTLKLIDQQVVLARKLLTAENPNAAEAARTVIAEGRSLFDDISSQSGLAQLYFETRAGALTILNDAVFRTEQRDRAAELKKEYDELIEAPDLHKVDAELQKALALARNVSAARTYANELAEYRTKYRKQNTDFDTALKKFIEKVKAQGETDAKAYDGSLIGELREMIVLIEQPMLDMKGYAKRWSSLFNKFGNLSAEKNGKIINIGAIKKDNEQTKNARDKAQADQQRVQEERNLLLRMVEAFTAQCKEDRKAMIKSLTDKGLKEKDFNKEEYDLVVKMAETAASQSETKLDVAKAEFDRAVKRLGRLKENPELPTIKGKDEVGKLAAKWSTAVGEVEANLRKVGKAARDNLTSKATVKGEPILEADLTEIEKTLADLAQPLDRAAFDVSLRTIAGDDTFTLKQRKAAREDALRKVRFYQDYLFGNPLMKHAHANPFGVEGVLTPLHKVLESLDLNVRRAVEVA